MPKSSTVYMPSHAVKSSGRCGAEMLVINHSRGLSVQVTSASGRELLAALRDRGRMILTAKRPMHTPEQARSMLQAVMADMWAASTMANRRRIFRRWELWCRDNGLPMTDESAMFFVLAIPELQPQGRLQYMKELSGMMRHLGLQQQQLLTVSSALRAHGAAIPLKQAAPLPRDVLLNYLPQVSHPGLRLALMVAWKTASRWGDVVGLTIADNFILVSDESVVIHWQTLPKGWKKDPFRPSMMTVIEGPLTHEIAMLARQVPQQRPFCPWTTEKLDTEWTRHPTMNPFTAHSIKHGAAQHLVAQAATHGNVEPQIISVLLKHKLSYELLANMSVRYIGPTVELARLMGTQRATRLL